MGLLDGIFGLEDVKKRLEEVEKRLERLEGLMEKEYEPVEKSRSRILEILSEPKTTGEIATEIGKSRSWTSYIVNMMEKEGLIREEGKRGKELLYMRTD